MKFTFGKNKKDPTARIEQSLDTLEKDIQDTSASRSFWRKWCNGSAALAGISLLLVVVVKAPVIIPFTLLCLASSVVSGVIGFDIERSLNRKYQAQASMLQARELAAVSEKTLDNAPKPASDFDTAAKVGDLERRVGELESEVKLEPVDLSKLKR